MPDASELSKRVTTCLPLPEGEGLRVRGKAAQNFLASHAQLWLCLSILAFAFPLRADVPDYKLGDTAQEDIITPVPLTVVNPDGTDTLKRREGTKVPMLFRFNASVADDAEAALRASFYTARTNFDDALYRTMKGKPEEERGIDSPLFQRAVQSAKQHGASFPLLEQLAPVWASGENDEATRTVLVGLLREVMTRPVIAARIEGFSTRNSMWLVPVDAFTNAPTPKDAELHGRVVRGDQMLTMSQARSQVQSNLPPELKLAGRYLASFVRSNALADTELTQLMRAQRTESLAVMDNYDTGQAIVRRGQTLDRKALAALTTLREKTAISTLQQKLATQQTTVAQDNHLVAWIAGGFGVVVVLLVLILRRVRSRQSATLMPMLANVEATDSVWRERALTAEAHAEQAKHAMKSGFMQWMRERLVQGLFHQRAELLSSQQKAEVEMHALEQRLEQLHTPLQERIAAYEKRIAELEKDLAVKGEENRELIKAKITLAKQQLTVERERGGGRFGEN